MGHKTWLGTIPTKPALGDVKRPHMFFKHLGGCFGGTSQAKPGGCLAEGVQLEATNLKRHTVIQAGHSSEVISPSKKREGKGCSRRRLAALVHTKPCSLVSKRTLERFGNEPIKIPSEETMGVVKKVPHSLPIEPLRTRVQTHWTRAAAASKPAV